MSLPVGLNFFMPNEVETFFASRWKPINEVSLIPNKFPGNYLIAWSSKNLAGKVVLPDDVEYVGMSNQKGGVRQRIRDFVKCTEGKTGHSGGITFYKKYCDGTPLSMLNHPNKLYFVEMTFSCNVLKLTRTPQDLLIMGRVCLLELELLAYIRHYTGWEPVCNTK